MTELDAVASWQAEFGRVRKCDNPREWNRIYRREYRQGLRRTNGRRSVLLRLLARSNVDPGEPLIVDPELLAVLGWCWPWYGALNGDGYGIIAGDVDPDEHGEARRRKRQPLVLVHRVALATALQRPIAPGMFACHKCNVRHCIRPTHLYEGTKVENEADKRGEGWVVRQAPKYGMEVAR